MMTITPEKRTPQRPSDHAPHGHRFLVQIAEPLSFEGAYRYVERAFGYKHDDVALVPGHYEGWCDSISINNSADYKKRGFRDGVGWMAFVKVGAKSKHAS